MLEPKADKADAADTRLLTSSFQTERRNRRGSDKGWKQAVSAVSAVSGGPAGLPIRGIPEKEFRLPSPAAAKIVRIPAPLAAEGFQLDS